MLSSITNRAVTSVILYEIERENEIARRLRPSVSDAAGLVARPNRKRGCSSTANSFPWKTQAGRLQLYSKENRYQSQSALDGISVRVRIVDA